MAKKKTQPTPVIKTTPRILDWLNNTGSSQGIENVVDTAQEGRGEDVPSEIKLKNVETTTPSQEVKESIEDENLNKNEKEQQGAPEKTDDIKEAQEQIQQAPQATKATSNQRKRSGSGKSYIDLFFTKPVKAEGEAESKTIVRISEESHWLIGVLLESAKKQGVTLSISDIIDNLVRDHREKYQVEVDEFITQWKIRKRIN
ncbi:DUF3408 domain-containing protein [Spirosoma sp. HMF3257]|uniref:DUF3408 domain-containing protein n=1 Tax=Spirosoma telluris TaxID=2183553 RepID=A0A327NG53_9BACT|nr:DUF3408 domain-containing protein [Spirosoma telluris]RAI73014.1 hypothetical protein HMF3257_38515 [Spirosoma telluris]